MATLDDIKRTINEHKQKLLQDYKITKIGIFGSYIRGEQKGKSDVDLLVEFGGDISLLGLVSTENYLSDILRIKVDLVPKEDVRPELRDRIYKEVVYI